MEWIKVEDKLPSYGQDVLVYQTYPKGTMFNAMACPLNRCFHKLAEFSSFGNFISDQMVEIEHVTHWMPLPTPPKE